MDSLPDPMFESIFKRLDRVVSFRGATNAKEILKRFKKAKQRRPDFAEQTNTLIEYGFVKVLLDHYKRGKEDYRKHRRGRTSYRIYKMMRLRRAPGRRRKRKEE